MGWTELGRCWGLPFVVFLVSFTSTLLGTDLNRVLGVVFVVFAAAFLTPLGTCGINNPGSSPASQQACVPTLVKRNSTSGQGRLICTRRLSIILRKPQHLPCLITPCLSLLEGVMLHGLRNMEPNLSICLQCIFSTPLSLLQSLTTPCGCVFLQSPVFIFIGAGVRVAVGILACVSAFVIVTVVAIAVVVVVAAVVVIVLIYPTVSYAIDLYSA